MFLLRLTVNGSIGNEKVRAVDKWNPQNIQGDAVSGKQDRVQGARKFD